MKNFVLFITTTFFIFSHNKISATFKNSLEHSSISNAFASYTTFLPPVTSNIDKDKDGIPDFVESNLPHSLEDHDNDGFINAYDIDYPGFIDYDGDTVNDWFQADGDVDANGIANYLDNNFPGRIDNNNDGVDDRVDSDLDGIPNMFDLDSDNDGITDVAEAGGTDENGDGKLDNFIDIDSDGLSDQIDANLTGAFNSGNGLGLKDTDIDGVPDIFDLDSDSDGIPDVREVNGIDVKNDGMADNFVDLNMDGLSDDLTGTKALLRTGPDTNGDGRPNFYPFHDIDKDNLSNAYDIDSDGDGMLDLIEAGFLDTNYDGRADGVLNRGWTITVSYLPSLKLRDYDKDGKPDYLDIDSDNDGITDHIEGPSTFDYKMTLGTDTDGDGLDDAHDNQPGLWGGSGVFPIDTDGDIIYDYLDSDSDDDDSPDIVEGHDYNFDGIANEVTTLLKKDTDGDGLDDRFDLDNSSAKGSSIRLGNFGSINGDPHPGTRAVVQQTPANSSNRDWRYIPFILPVEIINFTGAYNQNNLVKLKWTVNYCSPIERFEIYRSTDHKTFVKQPNLQVNVSALNTLQFSINDPVALVSANKILYRLEVVGKRKERLISNVISVNAQINTATVSVLPNPAKDQTILRIYSIKEGKAHFKLQDIVGRTLKNFSTNLSSGINFVPVSDLSLYESGVYNIQVILHNQLFNSKLVIIK